MNDLNFPLAETGGPDERFSEKMPSTDARFSRGKDSLSDVGPASEARRVLAKMVGIGLGGLTSDWPSCLRSQQNTLTNKSVVKRLLVNLLPNTPSR